MRTENEMELNKCKEKKRKDARTKYKFAYVFMAWHFVCATVLFFIPLYLCGYVCVQCKCIDTSFCTNKWKVQKQEQEQAI